MLPETQQINIIENHLLSNLIPPIEYENYIKAKHKWFGTDDYLNEDETVIVVCTASYYASLLRTTYRKFIRQMGFEPSVYWDAVVKVYFFGNIWANDWKSFFELKQTKNAVKKTMLPKWTAIGLVGCDWNKLRKMCEKWCDEVEVEE